MNKIILKIEGMSCSACSNSLEKYLKKQKGIVKVNVNLIMATALIEYDDSLTINNIESFVKKAGYISLGEYNPIDNVKTSKRETVKIIFYGIISFFVMYISMIAMIKKPLFLIMDPKISPRSYAVLLLILSLPVLFYGLDILKNGFKSLLNKNPNMDTLVSIGVVSSFLYSIFGTIKIFMGDVSYAHNLYFESAIMILFFIKLGRFIDKNSKNKTKEAIEKLVQITPQMAIIKKGNKTKKVTIDEVKQGDILVAKPGDKIAVDGEVVFGMSHLDETFITGESIPVKKEKGSKVIAGSINYSGYIEYKAEKIGKESTISEIVRLVIEAANTKPPIALFVDKISSYFVPIVMAISLITFAIYLLLGYHFSVALNVFVSILVISCPCALGLATPLAIVIAEGLCANNGILIKSSEVLENAHKVNTIVFDKTGTLTKGNLTISEIYNFSNISDNKLISIVASVERHSTHPIALAIVKYAKEKNIKLKNVTNFINLPGYGLKGKINNETIYIGNRALLKKYEILNKYSDIEYKLTSAGNSIVYVVKDKEVLGIIGVKDVLRENVKGIIVDLKSLNIKTIMLTGDNEKTANLVANEIGIEKVFANVLPKEKSNVIIKLKNKNQVVMMIGDGINDAPALTIANIGVSVSSGTDIANDSADIILLNDDLSKIISVLEISRNTIKNIKQNLFWAFIYNVAMIPIAIGFLRPIGIVLNPLLAGLAMTISSLSVVFNALRLKKMKYKIKGQ